MSDVKTIWLVGEHNPYGQDPSKALYPLPPNAAGGRLARALGLERTEYLRKFERRNLLQTAKWSIPKARAAADELLRTLPLAAKLVLLGAQVSVAFGLEFRKNLFQPRFTSVGEAVPRKRVVLVIPHPSGLSREWNDPSAVERLRAAFAVLEGGS